MCGHHPQYSPIALKQLVLGRLKRPYVSTYVILTPQQIYLEEWQGREKEMNIWFVCHTGECWPHFAHEPLLSGIDFPLYRHYPWQLRLKWKEVWWKSDSACQRCLKRVTFSLGIICTHFGDTQGFFQKCKSA